MPTSPDAFIMQVKLWTDKAKAAPMLVIRDAIQEINNEIISTTPYVTGYLSGSYFADINGIPSGAGSVGRPSTAAVNAVAATLNAGDTYIMGNTAKYARRVELGFVGTDSLGRKYNQHGRYWMKAVLNRAPQIAAASAARLAGTAT